MVTMHDVARHASVSVMTVSNVVNARPQVSDRTRERVLAAIDELGYHVNTTARNLRQGRTGVIGLALPDLDHAYFGLLARVLHERAARDGFELVVEQTGSRREAEEQAISRARLRSYDGLVLYTAELADQDAALLRGDYPIVVMGERSYAEPVDHVLMGNEEGARLATAHLIARGCRRIAMIGGRASTGGEVDVVTLRTRGFAQALDDAGVAVDARLVVDCGLGMTEGRRAVHELLAQHPDVDGVFCASDLVAIGVLRGLHERGADVPGAVKVAGFDDIAAGAFTTPSLTTIDPDHEGMADAVFRMLRDRLDGVRTGHDYREVVGTVRLIERESTG